MEIFIDYCRDIQSYDTENLGMIEIGTILTGHELKKNKLIQKERYYKVISLKVSNDGVWVNVCGDRMVTYKPTIK